MKKGFFIDLDGTLLDDEGHVSQEDKQIICDISKRHNVYLITGKSYHTVLPIYKKLKLNTFLITSMGQIISNPLSDEVLLKKTISSQEVSDIKKEMLKHTPINNYAVEEKQGDYYLANKNISKNLLEVIHGQFGNQVDSLSTINDIIGAYFEIDEENESSVLKIKNHLNELFKNKYFFTYWVVPGERYVIHARHYQANKWQAILKIQNHDQLDYIVAIGNGWNDKEMLEKADVGIAMINSDNKVKLAADFVSTHTNNQSGVSQALKKIIS